jgi:hypothetical protein
VFKVQWDKNNTNSSVLPKNLCRGRDIKELYTLKTLTLEERNQFILERNKIIDSNLFKKQINDGSQHSNSNTIIPVGIFTSQPTKSKHMFIDSSDSDANVELKVENNKKETSSSQTTTSVPDKLINHNKSGDEIIIVMDNLPTPRAESNVLLISTVITPSNREEKQKRCLRPATRIACISQQ